MSFLRDKTFRRSNLLRGQRADYYPRAAFEGGEDLFYCEVRAFGLPITFQLICQTAEAEKFQ